jgi:hypothetical protein
MKATTKVTLAQFIEIMHSQKGATFSGLTYHVDEGKSKTKNKKKALQKTVTVGATLNSVYQAKIDRILTENGLDFDWTPNKMTGRSYDVNDKNRCIVYKDTDSRIGYLCFVAETHAKPQVQLFRNGQPVERADVWNADYITPAGLRQNDKKAVQNSIFNHAIKASAAAEENGAIDLANELKAKANKIANVAELQKLEFMFRTVQLDNIIGARFGGENYIIEG